MSKPKVEPLRYTVVCPNFVSVHEEHLAAIKHAQKIAALGKCREKHTVAQTNLPYGSRHYPEEK
jgi:hypothetical protein